MTTKLKPDHGQAQHPLPGDVVYPASGPPRRVVACGTPDPPGYRGFFKAWACPRAFDMEKLPHVHWARLEGDTLSPRGGTMSLAGWRAWARGARAAVRVKHAREGA